MQTTLVQLKPFSAKTLTKNMYSQMLCGLYQRKEVLRVGTYFASSFIRAIQFLEKHCSLLCNDIRMELLLLQMPNKMLDLFPFLQFVCPTGLLMLSFAWTCVISGLYRYRVGDVLRVTGYKNNAPQFYFVCRENVILSIDYDKTDEAELQNAVKNAVHNLIPYDANVASQSATIPGHYVLFWELNVNGSTQIPPSVFEDCCLTIEESLNSVYREGRATDKCIGPLEIRIVETGTFDKLVDCCVSLGASIDQYKTPRCVKSAPLVELLNSRVVSSHFCPITPNWVLHHRQWKNMN